VLCHCVVGGKGLSPLHRVPCVSVSVVSRVGGTHVTYGAMSMQVR